MLEVLRQVDIEGDNFGVGDDRKIFDEDEDDDEDESESESESNQNCNFPFNKPEEKKNRGSAALFGIAWKI